MGKDYRRGILSVLLGLCAMTTATVGAQEATSHVQDVQAVTEVYGDGENLSAVILTYDKDIRTASLSAEDYGVPARTVRSVYARTVREMGAPQESGRYVVVELSPTPMVSEMPKKSPQEEAERAKRNAQGLGGPVLGSKGTPKPLQTFTATVSQIGEIETTDGDIYAPSGEELTSGETRQLVIEDFIQGMYRDPAQENAGLMYNLYIPKDYNGSKSYPLVVFMHDAGAVSSEIKETLSQGLGAISWASPEWQAAHPCFVLAPQYDRVTVDDRYEYGPELDRTMHLIESLTKTYAIDVNRIYNTGQSMGGMSAISLDARYPDFFAGSYIVASKWDVSVTAPMAHQHIYFVASEGDPGAFPSLNEITANLERNGAHVQRMTVDAQDAQENVNSAVQSAITPDCNVYYTVYTGGNHRYTWQYAYRMLPAMEWVFSNVKK